MSDISLVNSVNAGTHPLFYDTTTKTVVAANGLPTGPTGSQGQQGTSGFGIRSFSGPTSGAYVVQYTDFATGSVSVPVDIIGNDASAALLSPTLYPCYYTATGTKYACGPRVLLDVLTGSTGTINPSSSVTCIQGTGVYTLESGAVDGLSKTIIFPGTGARTTFIPSMEFGRRIPTTMVAALAATGTSLFVGGTFTGADNYLLAYNTATNVWYNPFGTGVNNTVSALLIYGTTLYVGGAFTTANGISSNRVAAFDTVSNTWQYPFDTGLSSDCNALEAKDNTLFVGGAFSTAGAVACGGIAAFDMSTNTWSNPFGTGFDFGCRAFCIINGILYVGGQFNVVNGQSWPKIVAYDIANRMWFNPFPTLGTNLGTVIALVSVGTDLYIAGVFNSLIRYDTLTNALTYFAIKNFNGIVYALQTVGTNIYIGGSFTIPWSRIVAFDTVRNTFFNPFGTGVNSRASVFTVIGNTVYVGGYFTQADLDVANYVAMFPAAPAGPTIRCNIVQDTNSAKYTVLQISATTDTAVIKMVYNKTQDFWIVGPLASGIVLQ